MSFLLVKKSRNYIAEDGQSTRHCLNADISIHRYESTDCKENLSPNKPLSTDLIRLKNVSSVARDQMDDRLLSLENVCTPVRRSTFVKARSVSSCDSSPQQMMKFDGGYQTENGSPVAIPDALTTPVRRTTFVKNVPKSMSEPARENNPLPAEHKFRSSEGSNQTFIRCKDETHKSLNGNVAGSKRGAPVNKCREFSKDPDNVQVLCYEQGPFLSRQLRDEIDDKQLLKDVSQSPKLLEEKLLKLQKQQQFRKRSSSKIPRQLSPGSDSEYHTAAMTTPFDDSFGDNNEFHDSISCPVHDSMVLSSTVTCDMYICQEVFSATAAAVTNVEVNDKLCTSNSDSILMATKNNQRLSNETYRIDRQPTDENIGLQTDHGMLQETRKSVCMNETVVVNTESVVNTQSKLRDFDCLAPTASATIGLSADWRASQRDTTTTVPNELFVIIPTSSDTCVSYQQYLEQTEFKDSVLEGALSMPGHSDILMNANKRLSSTPAFLRNINDNSSSSYALNKWLPRANAPSPIDIAPFRNSVKDHRACSGKLSQAADDGCFRRPLPVGATTRSQSVPPSNDRDNPLLSTGMVMSNMELNQTYVKSINSCVLASASEQKEFSNQTFIKASADCATGHNVGNRKTSSRHLFVEEKEGFGVTPLDSSRADGIVGVCKLGDCNVVVDQTVNDSEAEVKVSDKNETVGYWSDTEVSHISSKRHNSVFLPVGGQSSHMISPGQKRQSLIAKLNGTESFHQKGTTAWSLSHEQLPKPVRARSVNTDGASNRSRSLSSSGSVAARKQVERDKSVDSSTTSKRQELESASNTRGEVPLFGIYFKIINNEIFNYQQKCVSCGI
jgi:hypothetical protein